MIPGLRVGHVTDAIGLTGCTVILSDAPAIGGVEFRGWAAGVHGLEFLDPRHLVPTLDGVVLAGGSAFGLEAIWGVMRYLEERGVGFPTSQTVVPHVAGAILYDLGLGDSTARPDRVMGHLFGDSSDGFPVPCYPLSLQRAHEAAKLTDLDVMVLHDAVMRGIRSVVGAEHIIDRLELAGDVAARRY